MDGIVGSWFFDPWKAVAAEKGLDLRYVLLMPSEAETVARATARTAPGAMTDAAVVREMWRQFQTFPAPEGSVLNTTGQTPRETAAAIRAALDEGRFRLG